MRWLDRLERRFRGWTIPQFPLFIVAASGVIYVLGQIEPAFVSHLRLYPDAVRTGQWWRVVTFLFVPPNMSWLWLFFWLYLIYIYAQALEAEWGEFKFLLFMAVGAAATAFTSLALIDAPLGNMPLYTTLFLAFATLYPDFQLLLFFILPVKVKYLAILVWIGLGWTFLTGGPVARAGLTASLLNYALFFGPDIAESARLRWQVFKNRRRWPRG